MNEPDLSPAPLPCPGHHLTRPALTGRVVLILSILMITLALGSSAWAFSDHNAERREAALQRGERMSASSTAAAQSASAFRVASGSANLSGASATAATPVERSTSAVASNGARDDLASRLARQEAARRDAARRYAALRKVQDTRLSQPAALPAARRTPPEEASRHD